MLKDELSADRGSKKCSQIGRLRDRHLIGSMWFISHNDIPARLDRHNAVVAGDLDGHPKSGHQRAELEPDRTLLSAGAGRSCFYHIAPGTEIMLLKKHRRKHRNIRYIFYVILGFHRKPVAYFLIVIAVTVQIIEILFRSTKKQIRF